MNESQIKLAVVRILQIKWVNFKVSSTREVYWDEFFTTKKVAKVAKVIHNMFQYVFAPKSNLVVMSFHTK